MDTAHVAPPSMSRRTADVEQEQVLATTLALVVVVAVVVAPPVLLGMAVAAILWRLTAATTMHRWAVAVIGAATFALLHTDDQWLWFWRVPFGAAINSMYPPLAEGFPSDAIAGAIGVEALAGPLLLQFAIEAARRRRRILRQHLEDQEGRARSEEEALRNPSRRRRLWSRIAKVDHPPGKIRLGVTSSKQPFDLSPADLAQHVFLPGVSGSGKTTTLLRLGEGALSLGQGLVIVDCKGGDLGGVAREVARRFGVPFRVVDPDDEESLGYNPCSGNAASVTNKLLGAFSYEGAAEIYKLTAAQALPPIVRALEAQGEPVALEALRAAFGKGGMGRLARASEEPHRARLAELEQGRGQPGSVGDQAYTGLQYRLGALLEGKFGDVFRKTPTLDWDEALATPAVTYLALSATEAGEDVELFGRVIAQDLKQVSARRLKSSGRGESLTPALVVFDEFAALREAEQLTDLLLQARQAQLRVVVSTQYLPESIPVRKACLGAGLIIAHRVEAQDAEDLAGQLGTRTSFEVTHQIDFESGTSSKGSHRQIQEYIIHPQKLRTLRVGQAAVRSAPSDRHAIVHVTPPLSPG